MSVPQANPDFQALFDAAPGIYLVLDANFNMVAANEARLKATMTTREQIVGRYLFDLFPDNPQDPAADGVRNLRTSLERVLQTKAPDAMAVQKYDIRRPESEGGGYEVRYWSPLNTPVLGEDGKLKYIIHRVEDVTDFMRLKQERARADAEAQELLSKNEEIEAEIIRRAREVQEANRKLEAANLELGRLYTETHELAEAQQRFFSHVSHELRTPLTLVLGPIEKMLADPVTSPEQRRDLEVMGRNARTLLRHVNDLLDVVKYKSGSMAAQYSRTDLAERLRLAVAHFDSASTGRSVFLDLAAPPHLEAEVDIEKIDRILINLVSNAFKFSPNDGRVRCTLTADAQTAIITVADQGPGVPVDLRKAIFEPFRQGDAGLKRRASGTGLGLAIVRDFVALHGGMISVRDAEDGGGALFECRIPLRAPKGADVKTEANPGIEDWNFQQAVETASARDPVRATPALASAPLVLVVEDNQDMARFISEALASRYRTASAGNGMEGLAEAERLRPDLIVSDLMMPVMSGDQLVEALAERPRLCDIPVLLLTARADEDTRIEALRQGVQDFLAKPFSVEELRARVDNLVRAKQTADDARRGKRISEERYAQLMDGARDGVFILTAEGVILDANRRAVEFCGGSNVALIGAHFEEAFAVRPADGGALKFESDAILQLESSKPNDDERHCFEASNAIVTIDTEDYRLVIVRDVTEQRRLERHLRRAQKLEALGQMTGGIAHDFNNLLGAITISIEGLKRRLADGADAKALADNIERAADRGQAMTRRLLAFAKRQPLAARLCDINDIVSMSVEMLKHTLPPAIEVELNLDRSIGPVLIDPAQLEDALVNLALNARDAMPQGGVLGIATQTVSVAENASSPLPAGDYIAVRVSDTGIGMKRETLERVFEPFFTTKEEGKGTGLGLCMVHGFAHQAGGDVRIESAVGQGTAIEIVLPRASHEAYDRSGAAVSG